MLKRISFGLIVPLTALAFTGMALLWRPVSAQGPTGSDVQPNLINVPDLAFDATVVVDNLKMPSTLALGEAAGVDLDSKGNIYVYSRTGDSGHIRFRRSAQLFEFRPDGTFMREIGPRNNYIMGWAHSVRVDKDDNVWIVDNGTNLVGKYNQKGQQLLVLGRRQETVEMWLPLSKPGDPVTIPGMEIPGEFGEPTDVAFDQQGNIFVSDGYQNSRVQKFDKDGNFVKLWGSKGSEPGQLRSPHGIATDAQGNVYVADRGNNRIQVFDNDGKLLRVINTVPERLYVKDYVPPAPALGRAIPQGPNAYYNGGVPNSICISAGSPQYIYANDLMPGAIYKLTLDGKPVGKIVSPGRKPGQFAWFHEMSCSRTNPNEVWVSEMVNYRVQKVTFHPERAPAKQSSR